MSYILDGSTIRNPQELQERNSTLVVQNRVLSGNVTRDYMGSNKRVWLLRFRNAKPTDYSTIRAIYDSYLDTVEAKSWQVTETNYTVSLTYVHIDLVERSFGVRGESYISDFDLTLTEA